MPFNTESKQFSKLSDAGIVHTTNSKSGIAGAILFETEHETIGIYKESFDAFENDYLKFHKGEHAFFNWISEHTLKCVRFSGFHACECRGRVYEIGARFRVYPKFIVKYKQFEALIDGFDKEQFENNLEVFSQCVDSLQSKIKLLAYTPQNIFAATLGRVQDVYDAVNIVSCVDLDKIPNIHVLICYDGYIDRVTVNSEEASADYDPINPAVNNCTPMTATEAVNYMIKNWPDCEIKRGMRTKTTK